jgi:hypothetical protein
MKFLLLGAVFSLFLFTVSANASQDQKVYLTNGYGLLHHLCEQEEPLDMILIVKTAPKDVADFAHEVSRAAHANAALLEDLQDHDKSLRFDQPGLPQFEEDTRTSIRADKQHMLLFGTTNAAFARALLVTQIEAGTYGMNLAKVLADAEPDARRAAVVRKVSASFEKIRDKAYRLLGSE